MTVSKPRIDQKRQKRTRIYYAVFSIICVPLFIYLVYMLQALILPVVLGTLAAYLCFPLLSWFRRNAIPKGAGIMILFLGFILLLFLTTRELIRLIPDELEMMELRVNIQYQVNEAYTDYLGLEEDQNGNLVYRILGEELDPMMRTFNRYMLLDDDEMTRFQAYRDSTDQYGDPVIPEQSWQHYQQIENRFDHLRMDVQQDGVEQEQRAGATAQEEMDERSLIAAIINIASIWLIMPMIFLFLLFDDGQVKKNLIRLVPNSYFEMALTAFDNVDKAIGNYLRGTFLEIILMSATFWVFLVVIGFDWGISIILSLIAGFANVIPIFGSIVGLVVIAAYALIVDSINPMLPFITIDNVLIWSAVVVLIVQIIDNVAFKPFVLGKAVDLHPLVVFVGAIAGSIMFGFIGLLFSIPVIVIIKEIYTTIHYQLKAYFIIY